MSAVPEFQMWETPVRPAIDGAGPLRRRAGGPAAGRAAGRESRHASDVDRTQACTELPLRAPRRKIDGVPVALELFGRAAGVHSPDAGRATAGARAFAAVPSALQLELQLHPMACIHLVVVTCLYT